MTSPNAPSTTRRNKRLRRSDRFLLRLFEIHHTIDGLEIVCSKEEEFARVAAAMDLIKNADPLRYDRLLGDLDRIMVHILITGARAQYERSLEACQLDSRYVLDNATPTVHIASMIVHEATHARLERLGFQYVEHRRARLETICMRQELSCLARAQDGDELRDEIERTISNMPDFSNAAFSRRYEASVRETLRDLEFPGWLMPPLFAIRWCVQAVGRLLDMLRR